LSSVTAELPVAELADEAAEVSCEDGLPVPAVLPQAENIIDAARNNPRKPILLFIFTLLKYYI
jgi:hypothetical protein